MVQENRGWIDFRALCKSVEFSKVLELYNVQLKVKGDQASGFCPMPGHQGQKRSPSFSVNLGKGIFQCFGCGAKGNVLDFVARMEQLDPFKGRDIRRAAEILQEKMGIMASPPQREPPSDRHEASREKRPMSPPSRTRPNLPVVANAPLDFELKDLDGEHPYLAGRGFTLNTVARFDLGFCNRGMLKGRIAIPIHDEEGRLVAYAGRVINDRSITDENPKYLLPGPRERDGKLYEFQKSKILYNAHRIVGKVSDLIVVEGFPGTWWLTQHEYMNTVAVMGSDCSETQSKLILEKVEMDGRIWILTDGDEAGRRLADSLLVQLSPYRFVRWAKLKHGEQPTDCTIDDLQAMLSV